MIHLTLGVCTLALGVASEVVQGILPVRCTRIAATRLWR